MGVEGFGGMLIVGKDGVEVRVPGTELEADAEQV